MHIPDGYIGPPTFAAGYAACAGLWTVAVRRLGRELDTRRVPFLALSAAFSFIIMMFNVPIPGGTSGHAAGGVLIALLLGPWAAALAVSIALIIQALLFGDGGITAIGLNCLNIAFIMPFSGYFLFQALKRTSQNLKTRAILAGVAGWFGLNMAALATAIQFGLQPILHTDLAGHALYAPYPLSVAVPAMMAGHLALFGVIEGLVTALAAYYLERSKAAQVLLP